MSTAAFLQGLGRKDSGRTGETMTFEKYFNKVVQDPKLARTAVQRMYDMIMSYGVTEKPDGSNQYDFFKGKMFGAEDQIESVMRYYKAAAMGMDIKKRILFFLGPPGGGKSLLLSLLKKGYSDYTRTERGAIYRIKGCPISEDPLHLIEEQSARDEIWNTYKVKIEGKLCPYCKHKKDYDWKNNISHVEVERFFVDEESRTGIGTFAPAQKNDMAELWGSTNLRKITETGNEADAKTYDFNGELHKANRGIMEFIEILKADAKFLHILLTLAEEQNFKSPRFPLQYVDETLIAHTNEGEFRRFIAEKENEAIIDRLYIVQVPYSLDVKNEELIYQSALKKKLVVKGITVHPGAIRFASTFAVATRLNQSGDKSRDGMEGVSPRFIMNALAIAMVDSATPEVQPATMYKTLRKQVMDYPVYDAKTKDMYVKILDKLAENIDSYSNVQRVNTDRLKSVNADDTMFDKLK